MWRDRGRPQICVWGQIWPFASGRALMWPARSAQFRPCDAGPIQGRVDDYLAQQEAQIDGLRDYARKRVIWAGATGQKTKLSVVYIHGFSASSEELRPVPDIVAQGLGANLFFTRLQGHGATAQAMGQGCLQDWLDDVAQALAVGAEIGEEVLVLSCSTGGTLMALAAAQRALDHVAGAVFVSPNFKVKAKGLGLLTLPFARHWMHLFIGRTRRFEPRNAAHAKYWLPEYPTTALIPLAQAVQAAQAVAFDQIRLPALFVYDPMDQVVDAAATQDIATRWGGPSDAYPVTLGSEDDPAHHVIAGQILSPGMTDPVSLRILDWAKGLRTS